MPMTDDNGELCCSPVHAVEGQPQTTPVMLTDALGLTWCADCQHRGEFVNQGKRQGWPALASPPYALARGASFWYHTATLGDDERVWALLACSEATRERDTVKVRG